MGCRLGLSFVVAMFIIRGSLLALIPPAAVFWAGDLGTFDFDDIFLRPSLAWPDRSFRVRGVAFSPRPYPNVLQRTASPQAFLEMGMTTRSKKSLTRDSDIDASLRLIDGVRNTPTAATPFVPTPNPASNVDEDVAVRRYLQEQSKLVDEIYKARLHRAWAKSIREDILGDKKHHFRGTDDAGLLSDLVVQLRTEFQSAGLELCAFDLDDPLAPVVNKVNGLLYDVLALVVEKHSNAYVWLTGTDSSTDRDGRRALVDIIKGCVPVALRESQQEEHAALRYPANVDPQPILAKEQRLVRDNRASDWTPTEATRKLSLYTRLDPTFYAAVKVRYPMTADLAHVSLVSLRSMVVEIYQAWAQTGGGKVASGADGVSAHLSSSEYDALLQKITELKELVQRQQGEAAPVVRQQRERVQQRQQQQRGQQPRGFRVGTHKAPPVGFDRDDQRAKPFCGRCKKAGKGEAYHFYRDCPLGGRQHPPTSAAAFCVPIDEEDAEGVHALAMCALFQQAADDGAESFARAAAAYGPPAVLCAGAVGGIDVSAYGFTVEQQPDSEGDDILRRLDDLAAEVHSAANPQVHYTHASFPPPAGNGQGASALVCVPAAAVATPEEQVPAGGAAASASAVPAPAMPVSQGEDVKPAPLQSARVTTTADADGEFAGFVQTVNHATVEPVDLTGYDTDDYEDFADGSFVVKPRASAISANHSSTPAARAPHSGGALGDWHEGAPRSYGCGKPPWGFPAHAGLWGMPFLLSFILLISVVGVGAAAYTVADDVDPVRVSGRAARQPVLCRSEESPLVTVPCAIPPRLHRRVQRRQGLYMAPVPWHPGPPPPGILFQGGPPLSPASSSDDEAPPSGSTWQHPGAVQPPVIDESTTPTPSNSLANDFSVTDTLHFGSPVLLRRATAGYYGAHCGDGAPLAIDPE
ncbi:hypothetical protein CYMTET_18569 [Cymbomonas tetramitiformis]|uniref:Uncharacterized protein n=1 Tax=Cymbomonas tetramitiformis TaxID=36881 RepID=A0AAE0G855_9CHLO|nr:hypothetical protein CYMTET_18569 [Cymbomonas tetramitiformis]